MSLVGQVRSAFNDSGLSVSELLDKSGLAIDRSSLQRKLTGDQPTTSDELEALAKALGITLQWPRKKRRAA